MQAAVQHKGEVLPGTVSPQEATRRGWYAHSGPFKWPAPKAAQVGGYEVTNTVMRHHGGAAWLWCTAEGAAVGHSTGWCACAWLTLLSQQLWWDRAPCSAVRSLGRQHDVLCSGQAVALCNADVQPASQAALPGAH